MARAPWIIAGAAAAALVGVVMLRPGGAPKGGSPVQDHASAHPAPRPGITAGKVLPISFVPRTPGSGEAYAAAREAAATLDGVYCYCDCSKHAGHRSLLTCFESDHGAYCDVCMGEAIVAHGMTQQGRSLDEIRTAIDRQFGT
ncbi:MAG TPA: CYCXC family (seleno)protein [Gemmatimonadales bacterium]|nr:CYCXC family (seleno)protein [Gemmatimonadales bacterium]